MTVYDDSLRVANMLRGLKPRLKLHLLEAAWCREVEEIAALSDSLLLPQPITKRLDELRTWWRES